MRRKTPIRFFTLLLLLFATSIYAAAQENCLSYEPDTVELSGTISRKTLPGPPNYESIRKGDKPETLWILHLDRPICVTGNTDDVNEPERNVTDLQLVLDEKQYAQVRKFTGQRIRLTMTGTLFHAHTAHHRTSVLLAVKGIKQNSGVRIQNPE
jgi:Domain of unknown function (DUF4431)